MRRTKRDATPIHGRVARGFEDVEAEFKSNFTERGELGAACAVYLDGAKIVDLWGGCRDHRSGAPWAEDTLVLVFSTTKGIAAIAMAVAHARGLIDYDERVAKYWPEFAQQGKESVTIRQLLAHQAGLCAIDEPLNLDVLADRDGLAAILARQRPAWEPGTKHGYHCWSLGWYLSELLRQADPQSRSLGQFFQEEIAGPLALEFYIGLPRHIPNARIARMKPARVIRVLRNLDKLRYLKSCMNPLRSGSITYRTIMNPRVLSNHSNYNRRDLQSIEIPSANGIGQVRSMAKLYGDLATGGKALRLGDETLRAVTAPPVPPRSGWRDEVLMTDQCYALGFLRPLGHTQFGSSGRAFGFAGAGGSFAFADPDARIGYAYAPNRMGVYPFDDPRELALRTALYRGLGRLGARQ